MRAVLVGLVGAVLVVGGAAAGSCRPGHLVAQERVTEATVGEPRTFIVRSGATLNNRTVLKVAVDGSPYVLDIERVPHMTPDWDSYKGIRADKGGSLRWSASYSKLNLPNDFSFFVASGPLSGIWNSHCTD